MLRALGKHLIAELWTREPSVLDNPDLIRDSLIAAAKRGNFSVLNVSVHQFEPQGVTGILLLSESHMSIHTWPEYGYAAVDIFTCGGAPEMALQELKRRLDADRMEVQELDRGLVGNSSPRPSHTFRHRAVDIS